MKPFLRSFLLTPLLLMLLAGQPVFAQNYTVDAGHPDTVGGFPPPDDILGPGFPPFPVLPGGGGVDVDGFSMGHFGPITPFHPLFVPTFDFSVDAVAVGAAGTAVAGQVALFDAETDVFRSFGFGGNVLLHDGDGSSISVIGPLGIAEGGGAPGPTLEGVDGFDSRLTGAFGGPIYWSVDAPSLGAAAYIGASAADIFAAPPAPGFAGAPGPWAGAAALGLVAADDIDAVDVYDLGTVGVFDAADAVLFSLAPGSPSLGILGVAPGDILLSGFGGFAGVLLPDVALGLGAGDNLNALSSAIPEPGSMALLALLGCGILGRRRTRPRND